MRVTLYFVHAFHHKLMCFLSCPFTLQALVMACRLGEPALAERAVEAVPHASIALVASEVPRPYLGKLLSLLARKLAASPHLEYYLTWACQVLNAHGRYIRSASAQLTVPLRQLQKSLSQQHDAIGRLCGENKYALQYLLECK